MLWVRSVYSESGCYSRGKQGAIKMEAVPVQCLANDVKAGLLCRYNPANKLNYSTPGSRKKKYFQVFYCLSFHLGLNRRSYKGVDFDFVEVCLGQILACISKLIFLLQEK